MARVKNGAVTKARHKKVLKAAKGYFGSKHRLYKRAKEQLMTSRKYAYRDRKQKKRDFRKLWIARINAACRMNEISYSKFINGLTRSGVEVNRKMLSELAINDPKAFTKLVEIAKKGLELKEVKEIKVDSTEEVTVNGKATKSEAKKETKKEVKEDKKETKKEVKEDKKETKKEEKEEKVNYSAMKVAELKEIAASKNIDVTGMKKADIVAALEK